MIDLSAPLDLNNASAPEFLAGIQGNIIKGHGRDHTAHLVVRIKDPDAARKWIVQFAAEYVTTASTARRMTASWRASGGPGESFAMFLLSADGYRNLGLTEADIPVPNDPFDPEDAANYFKFGMKRQGELTRSFNDPPSTEWEAPFQGAIDAMVLMADDLKDRLEELVSQVTASMKGIFDVLTVERGDVQTIQFPRGELVIEHFGFQDGVSQPILIRQDADREIAQRGSTHWNPDAPLSLALVAEPGPGGRYGSFMVFRKLEQNVKGFWDALQQISDEIGIAVDQVGALAVGRTQDGIPMVPTAVVVPGSDPNDFSYDQDPDAALCPFHAHVRKTNPRGDVPRNLPASSEFERARRIVRRGITYGARPDLEEGSKAERPRQGVGLLFMCFQSTLDQFAIQQEGSDINDFVKAAVGPDAVIGQSAAPAGQNWLSHGQAKVKMVNFVKLLGGEYFFAPSMDFLRSLSR